MSRYFILTAFLLNSLYLTSPLHAHKIGILGDSFAVGAFSNPALTYDLEKLTKIARGETSLKVEGEMPKILWPSWREYRGSQDWYALHVKEGLSYAFLSTPQYGWPYLASRRLNIEAKDIFLAANFGAKMGDLTRQIDRILDVNKKEIPNKILIFFTSNDLCSNMMNGVTSSEDFGNSLTDGLHYLIRNGVPPIDGTKVYIPHYLPMTQWITSEAILSHSLNVFGATKTCREIRREGVQIRNFENYKNLTTEANYVNALLPFNFANQCPTLFHHEALAVNQLGFFSNFSTQETKQSELAQIRNEFISLLSTRVRNYRIQSDLAVKKANDWAQKNFPNKKITFEILHETGDLIFEGKDLAPDCFHLSLEGQKKVAEVVFKGLH